MAKMATKPDLNKKKKEVSHHRTRKIRETGANRKMNLRRHRRCLTTKR